VRMWETTSTVPRARRFALAAELGLSESFTQPETWGRGADLTTHTNGHDKRRQSYYVTLPAEDERRISRSRVEYPKLPPWLPETPPEAAADTQAWSEVASYLLILRTNLDAQRTNLDGVIRFVLERVHLEQHEELDK